MSKAHVVRYPDRSAVCQRCQRPLGNPWRSGGQLCWQCGMDDELFRPETRWMAETDGVQPPSEVRPGLSWWQRLLGNLRKPKKVGALSDVTFLLTLCTVLASSLVRAADCSDALIAEACACRSPGPSKQQQLVTSPLQRGDARKVTPSLGNPRLDRFRPLEKRLKARVAVQ